MEPRPIILAIVWASRIDSIPWFPLPGLLNPSSFLRWILNILHDPKYLIPWELKYYSISRSLNPKP